MASDRRTASPAHVSCARPARCVHDSLCRWATHVVEWPGQRRAGTSAPSLLHAALGDWLSDPAWCRGRLEEAVMADLLELKGGMPGRQMEREFAGGWRRATRKRMVDVERLGGVGEQCGVGEERLIQEDDARLRKF